MFCVVTGFCASCVAGSLNTSLGSQTQQSPDTRGGAGGSAGVVSSPSGSASQPAAPPTGPAAPPAGSDAQKQHQAAALIHHQQQLAAMGHTLTVKLFSHQSFPSQRVFFFSARWKTLPFVFLRWPFSPMIKVFQTRVDERSNLTWQVLV